MKIPFLDLKRIYRLTEHDIDRAVRHVLESGHYILGEKCKTFEADLKDYLVRNESGHVVGCNSGTDALVLPLLARNIGSGDEVITPSHTAIPTITAIRATGATPVFVDVDPKTWVMDLDDVEHALTDKTRAIIAVHLYGNMVDIPKLRGLLEEKDRMSVTIIEDCAQSHGSSFQGKQAGTMGDFGAYSFYPTKNIGALGDAGAVFTRSSEDFEKLQMLRNYGQKDRYNAILPRGINSRLDELQAAILSARLKYLEKWKAKKDQMMNAYIQAASESSLQFQTVTQGCDPHWHLCVVKNTSQNSRDDIQKMLEEKGIQTLIHYPLPTHLQAAFKDWRTRSLPVTEELAKSILSLPLNPALMVEEVQYIAHTLQEMK